MAFIRKRRSSKDRCSYQVIETYREGGKVKQRTLCNLERYPTLEHAIQGEIEALEFYRSWSWPPKNLVRQYGRQIPAAVLAEAEAERQATESKYQNRIRELQDFQRSHSEL